MFVRLKPVFRHTQISHKLLSYVTMTFTFSVDEFSDCIPSSTGSVNRSSMDWFGKTHLESEKDAGHLGVIIPSIPFGKHSHTYGNHHV